MEAPHAPDAGARGSADPVELVVFDVNETLSDLSGMDARWRAVGAPEGLSRRWFAEVLRDGFGLAAAGGAEPFAAIAESTARRLLRSAGVPDVGAAVADVMAAFGELDVHPDVPDGVRALRAHGLRLVTLSNGAAGVADGLLTRAGVRDEFEQLLSVEDAGRWKPAPEPYRYAVEAAGVEPAAAMLVAVHPWDVDGASRVGLLTAWIDRDGEEYPDHLRRPDVVAASVLDLADVLAGTTGGR